MALKKPERRLESTSSAIRVHECLREANIHALERYYALNSDVPLSIAGAQELAGRHETNDLEHINGLTMSGLCVQRIRGSPCIYIRIYGCRLI